VDTQFRGSRSYEHLGCAAFGELADDPPGFTRTLLKKPLR